MSNVITIGRSLSCDVVVNSDEHISREHAQITLHDGQYIFQNLGVNGSTLNGKALEGLVPVSEGDNILLAGRVPLPWDKVVALLPNVQESTPTTLDQRQAQNQFQPQQQPQYGPQPGFQPQQQPQYGRQPGFQPQQPPQYGPQPGFQAQQQPQYGPQQFAPVDNTDYSDLNLALKILSFLFPIVGLVSYFVYRKSAPNKASQAGKWAGIGFVVGMIINLLSALG